MWARFEGRDQCARRSDLARWKSREGVAGGRGSGVVQTASLTDEKKLEVRKRGSGARWGETNNVNDSSRGFSGASGTTKVLYS
jgi:hypothetical protein